MVLLGAEVAYAHQTLSLYRREVRGKAAGTAARETIGLAIALCCARAFHERTQPWHPDALSDSLDVPLRTVREVLRALEQAEIVFDDHPYELLPYLNTFRRRNYEFGRC